MKYNNIFEPGEVFKCISRATFNLLEEQKDYEANTAGGDYTLVITLLLYRKGENI